MRPNLERHRSWSRRIKGAGIEQFKRLKSSAQSCVSFRIFTEIENFPAQFLHSQKLPDYLQLNQYDAKVLSPAQDETLGNRMKLPRAGCIRELTDVGYEIRTECTESIPASCGAI
jgi:hypothetical protein